jgi:hypothetical protein
LLVDPIARTDPVVAETVGLPGIESDHDDGRNTRTVDT